MIRLALGWTIVHSLWEGAFVALVLVGALCVLRSSRARYAAACLAMLGMLIGFGCTLSHVIDAGTTGAATAAPTLPRAPLDVGPGGHGKPSAFTTTVILPWLTPLWIAGVIAFHLYSLASWMAARRMLRRGVCSAPELWQRRLAVLRDRLRLATPVKLLESCIADVPVVIGYLRPVVLVPIGMLAGMSAGQIEAILLHELAHIRRRDYLVNLLQTVVEGFLFYHPAVWWISGVIRAERENCCDDLVVALSGDAQEYAEALATLELTRTRCSDAVLASTGGNLMKRIRRLLYPLDAPRTVPTPVLSAAILTLTAALALSAWQSATPPPVTPYQRWLKEDVAQIITDRETPYQRWLNEEVVYIINDRERAAFKDLRTDEEREMFIQQFWERRNPTPGSSHNPFKEEHYRRIDYTNRHFFGSVAGWKTDRGRVYIVYGPPDEIESHPAGGTLGGRTMNFPFEQWLYHHIEGVGDNVIIEFDDTARTGDYQMTRDPDAKHEKGAGH